MVSGGGGCTPPPPSTTTTRKGTTSAAALASPSSTRSSSLPSTWPLRHHVHQLHHSHHLKQPLHREPAGCLAHQHDSCHGRRLGVHDEALPAPATPPARQAAERASRCRGTRVSTLETAGLAGCRCTARRARTRTTLSSRSSSQIAPTRPSAPCTAWRWKRSTSRRARCASLREFGASVHQAGGWQRHTSAAAAGAHSEARGVAAPTATRTTIGRRGVFKLPK
jgi:hypothetical protein